MEILGAMLAAINVPLKMFYCCCCVPCIAYLLVRTLIKHMASYIIYNLFLAAQFALTHSPPFLKQSESEIRHVRRRDVISDRKFTTKIKQTQVDLINALRS